MRQELNTFFINLAYYQYVYSISILLLINRSSCLNPIYTLELSKNLKKSNLILTPDSSMIVAKTKLIDGSIR